MAQGIMYITTYVECRLLEGNIWDSQLFALVCFPSKNPLAVVPMCVQEQRSLWWLLWEIRRRAKEGLKTAERSKARLKSHEEFTFTFDMVCVVCAF